MIRLRFITALTCLFGGANASSTSSGYNTPILLNLEAYHSLDPYQQAVEGTIKLHLTLVFTQMSNEMIAAVKDPLEIELRHSALLNNMTQNIRLRFKEFGLLGNHLVAFYTPSDLNLYQEFIEAIRQTVRDIAGQMGNLQYSQKDKVEYGQLNQDIVYTMDIRLPLPHVSLKYNGTSQEAQKLNAFWQKGTFQKPKPLSIRLNQIELQLTKSIKL